MFAEWDKTYSVGVKELDDQHKKLFEIVNSLYNSILFKRNGETLENLFSELTYYMNEHFHDEEELMRQYEYPDLETHIKEHQELREKVDLLVQRFKKGEGNISMELLVTLIDWLHEHMGSSDGLYKPFFEKKGIN